MPEGINDRWKSKPWVHERLLCMIWRGCWRCLFFCVSRTSKKLDNNLQNSGIKAPQTQWTRTQPKSDHIKELSKAINKDKFFFIFFVLYIHLYNYIYIYIYIYMACARRGDGIEWFPTCDVFTEPNKIFVLEEEGSAREELHQFQTRLE